MGEVESVIEETEWILNNERKKDEIEDSVVAADDNENDSTTTNTNDNEAANIRILVPTVQYVHHPIEDLSVPSNSNNLKLLLWKLLHFLDDDNANTVMYIHCWGGRGRAGLTACCLVTLLAFATDADDGSKDNANKSTSTSAITVERIFDIVQSGYNSR